MSTENSDTHIQFGAVAIVLLIVAAVISIAMFLANFKVAKGETIPAPTTPVITATVPAFVTYEQPFTVTFISTGGSALIVTSPFSGTSSPYATDGSGQSCLHIGINPDRYSCPVDLEMTWVMVPRIAGKHDLKFEILNDNHDVIAQTTYTTIVTDKIYQQRLPLVLNEPQ